MASLVLKKKEQTEAALRVKVLKHHNHQGELPVQLFQSLSIQALMYALCSRCQSTKQWRWSPPDLLFSSSVFYLPFCFSIPSQLNLYLVQTLSSPCLSGDSWELFFNFLGFYTWYQNRFLTQGILVNITKWAQICKRSCRRSISHFHIPQGSSLWSLSHSKVFQALTVLRFFHGHLLWTCCPPVEKRRIADFMKKEDVNPDASETSPYPLPALQWGLNPGPLTELCSKTFF